MPFDGYWTKLFVIFAMVMIVIVQCNLYCVILSVIGRKSNEISLAMKKTFEVAILTELYPMSKIDIFVEVLQSDGGNCYNNNNNS